MSEEELAALKALMRDVATLYALMLSIDELAERALKNGNYYEIDAALVEIRDKIKPIKEG
jgi:hypothetical protein